MLYIDRRKEKVINRNRDFVTRLDYRVLNGLRLCIIMRVKFSHSLNSCIVKRFNLTFMFNTDLNNKPTENYNWQLYRGNFFSIELTRADLVILSIYCNRQKFFWRDDIKGLWSFHLYSKSYYATTYYLLIVIIQCKLFYCFIVINKFYSVIFLFKLRITNDRSQVL